MKSAAIAMVATANMAAALTQQCSGAAFNEGGNFFCGAINHILYQGIGGSGNYEEVTHMGPTGECKKTSQSYSGPLAPFDEDVSLYRKRIAGLSVLRCGDKPRHGPLYCLTPHIRSPFTSVVLST